MLFTEHDLRERHHQRRQGTPITAYVAKPSGPAPFRRGACPTISRLERVLHRDNASVSASRLSRDLPPLERAARATRTTVAAQSARRRGISDAQMSGDTEPQ